MICFSFLKKLYVNIKIITKHSRCQKHLIELILVSTWVGDTRKSCDNRLNRKAKRDTWEEGSGKLLQCCCQNNMDISIDILSPEIKFSTRKFSLNHRAKNRTILEENIHRSGLNCEVLSTL